MKKFLFSMLFCFLAFTSFGHNFEKSEVKATFEKVEKQTDLKAQVVFTIKTQDVFKHQNHSVIADNSFAIYFDTWKTYPYKEKLNENLFSEIKPLLYSGYVTNRLN